MSEKLSVSAQRTARMQRSARNIADLRSMASKRLPRAFFEFVDRGTEDEVALQRNRDALEQIRLSARVFVDIDGRSTETELFGRKWAMPAAIGPTGVTGLLWHDGERALARAAAHAGVPFTLATSSVASVEEIAEIGGNLWYQLYLWRDRALSYQMVDCARQAGFHALVITVDGVVSPNREYNLRNGYTVPFHFTASNTLDVLRHPRWLFGTMGRYLLGGGIPEFKNYPPEVRARVTARTMDRRALLSNPTLCWDDLRTLRRAWPGPLIVKGIMRPDDARQAVSLGADAVLVSNHGGRNLDSAPATIEVLPRITEAVGERAAVLVDSGFRRGSDIVKALALGARGVLLGRGPLYGMAAAGEAGAARALAIYREEIDRIIGLLGLRSIADVGPDCIWRDDRTDQGKRQSFASTLEGNDDDGT